MIIRDSKDRVAARVMFRLVPLLTVWLLQPIVVHAADKPRSAMSETIVEPSTKLALKFDATQST